MVQKANDVGGLSDAALLCRMLGHGWTWLTDTTIVKDGSKVVAINQDVKCFRCGTVRPDEVSVTTGDRKARGAYDYADDYLMGDGHGRVSRSDVRLEWMRRNGV